MHRERYNTVSSSECQKGLIRTFQQPPSRIFDQNDVKITAMPYYITKNRTAAIELSLFLTCTFVSLFCDAWSISRVAGHSLFKACDHRTDSVLGRLAAVEPTKDQSILDKSTTGSRAKKEEASLQVHRQSWNNVFERLKSFHQNHGHAHAPFSFDDGKRPLLGRWVGKQRENYRKGLLSEEKIQKLNSLGFIWQFSSRQISDLKSYEESWHSVFQRLLLFKQQFGHFNVTSDYDDGSSTNLRHWVLCQRRYYNAIQKNSSMHGSFSQERIAKLEEIGFGWENPLHDQRNDRWNEKFEKLKAFKSKYNSTKMIKPLYGSKDPLAELARWTLTQIKEYGRFMANKTTSMTPVKVDRMESIGFAWTFRKKTTHERWLHEYFKLYFHSAEFNNTNITSSNGHSSRLVNWLAKQKEDYQNGKLSQGKIDLLNEIDFDWRCDPPATWDEMYQKLCEYQLNHNSTIFNKKINKELAQWVQNQRYLYSKGSLNLDKVVKLNSLGFQWDVRDESWNAMCDRLKTYKRKYGSVLVPSQFPEDPPLGKWVERQRVKYSMYFVDTDTINDTSLQSAAERLATKILPAEVHKARLIRLCNLDFVWSFFDAQWLEKYEKLIKLKQENNSTLNSVKYANPQMVIWVDTQRYNNLSEKRRSLLDAIGFVWDPLEERWQEMFERYCYSKDHCGDVTVLSKTNRELVTWTNSQRDAYRWRRISEERIAKLESIGFDWTRREFLEA